MSLDHGALARRLPTRLVAAALLTQFPISCGADGEQVRADMLRLGVGGVIGHLHTQLTHNVRAEAGHINAPTLLLAGIRDLLTRSGAHRALHTALLHAQLVELPSTGHDIFLSHSSVLLRALALWIEQCEATRMS